MGCHTTGEGVVDRGLGVELRRGDAGDVEGVGDGDFEGDAVAEGDCDAVAEGDRDAVAVADEDVDEEVDEGAVADVEDAVASAPTCVFADVGTEGWSPAQDVTSAIQATSTTARNLFTP